MERAAAYAALGDPARLAIVETLAVGDRSPGELSQLLSTCRWHTGACRS